MKNVGERERERACEKSGRNKRHPKGETRKTCLGPVDDEQRAGVMNERESWSRERERERRNRMFSV